MLTRTASRLVAPLAIAILAAPATGQSAVELDTLRVGSSTLRSVRPGVDTVDVFNVENGVRTLSRVAVVRRTTEQYQGRNVLHITVEDGRTRTDARLDPVTLQIVRFERVASMDSTMFSLANNCFTGWSDMANQPRKLIQCAPAANRFGSGALDATVVSALPLRSGWNVRVATFDAFGDITSYPVLVVRMDTLRLATREYAAWRVDRVQGGQATLGAGGATSGVEVKTTWWVDVAAPRVLQERQTITIQGTTRETLRVLRNP